MANSSSPTKPLIVRENDLFYFESDHLALKGNKDYSDLLKTIFILESQQSRAVKDYEKVVELHKQALENPHLILDKLKNGECLDVPDLQVIAEIPTIDWSKYPVQIPEEGLKFLNDINNGNVSNSNIPEQHKTETKLLHTHNKPWTTEEQKRLEELLVIFPPEPIEHRRFKKIASALGNRTVQQVSSRIQKYFLKLYKAGLPIPGRIPKYAERCKKSKLHMHQKNNHYLFKPSTFFPQFDLPVVINEAEDIPGPSNSSEPIHSTAISGNYLMPESTMVESEVVEKTLPEEPKDEMNLQIQLLQKVKADKRSATELQLSFQNHGFRCDYCDEEPIVGTRWHCITCKNDSIDFCSDCVISQTYSGNAHPLTHKLEPCRIEDTLNTSFDDLSSDSESISDSSSNRKHKSSDKESKNGSDSEDMEPNDEQSSEDYDLFTDGIKYESDFELDPNELDAKDDLFGNFLVDNEDDNEQITNDEKKLDVKDNFIQNNSIQEIDIYDPAGNEENTKQEDSNTELFTDTQNIAYSYLHSHLLDEDM